MRKKRSGKSNKYNKSPQHPNIRNRVANNNPPELKYLSGLTGNQQCTYTVEPGKHVQNTTNKEDGYIPTTVLELTNKNINLQQHNSENGNRSESDTSSHLDDDFSNNLANLTSTPKNDNIVNSDDGSTNSSKSEVGKLKSCTDTSKNDKGHNTFIPSSKKNNSSLNGTPVIFPVLIAAVFTATLVAYLVFHSLSAAGITAGIGVCVIAGVTYCCSKPSSLVEENNIAQVASSDKIAEVLHNK